MGGKNLNLGEPLVRCLLYDAYPLSILATKDNYLGWFYSNYIHLCCHNNYLTDDLYFDENKTWVYNNQEDQTIYENKTWFYNNQEDQTIYEPINKNKYRKKNKIFLEFFGPSQALFSPFIKFEILSWKVLIDSNIEIIELIKHHIENNYYFYGFINEYYIPESSFYLKEHFIHDFLIYGYDDRRGLFLTAGYSFYNSQEMIYTTSKIKYNDFYNAFINKDQCENVFNWNDNIYFLTKNSNTRYNVDLSMVIESLTDYLNSKNISDKYLRYCNSIKSMNFGVSVYSKIIEYYALVLDDKYFSDVRIPFLLWEHKKCMVARFEYINNIFRYIDFPSNYHDKLLIIEKETKTLIYILIKYILTKNKKILQKSVNTIKNIRSLEYETLNYVCDFYSSKLKYKQNTKENNIQT
jgi:hypothetical protein